MKNKIFVINLFILIVFALRVNALDYGYLREEVIEKTLQHFNGQVIEYGSRIIVKDNKNNKLEDIYNSIRDIEVYKELNASEESFKINVIENPSNNTKSIDIILKSEYYKSKKLAESFIKHLSKNYEVIKTYKYVKTKIKDGDLSEYSKDIEKLLSENQCGDIKIDNITSGITGTACTHKHSMEENSEDTIDLNFAICRYTSGTYMIIGTPVITCIY